MSKAILIMNMPECCAGCPVTECKFDNMEFCMKKCAGKTEYQVKVGREIFYSHWDFDTAVKEYWIVRKEQANKAL